MKNVYILLKYFPDGGHIIVDVFDNEMLAMKNIPDINSFGIQHNDNPKVRTKWKYFNSQEESNPWSSNYGDEDWGQLCWAILEMPLKS